MIRTKFDTIELNKTLSNISQYSSGFLHGIEMEQIHFNRVLGGYTAESLGYYIDSKARSNPSSLHHVYEWNRVGDMGARLFSFNVNATKYNISFLGKFRQSKSLSGTSKEPFYNKA